MKRDDIKLCAWCEEPIEPGESNDAGSVHYECGLRSVIGSIGHQKRRCFCYGGKEEDPPGLNRRQAAVAAALYFHLGERPA